MKLKLNFLRYLLTTKFHGRISFNGSIGQQGVEECPNRARVASEMGLGAAAGLPVIGSAVKGSVHAGKFPSLFIGSKNKFSSLQLLIDAQSRLAMPKYEPYP